MKRHRDKAASRKGKPGRPLEGPRFPYTVEEVAGFFTRHASARVAYFKIERSLDDFGHYLCEVILEADGERLLLQGIKFRGKRFRYPDHLSALPPQFRSALERRLLSELIRSRVIESPLEDPLLAYTGERVVPGTTPFHAYWMHARRYGFAAARCRGGRVLDAGCGTGYGTRILSLGAGSCLGIDIDPEAVSLARALFGGPGVSFEVADVTRPEGLPDRSFDAIVSLEVLEHLGPGEIPRFMASVARLLAPAGTFIVSVASREGEDRGENPHHRSEMTQAEFRALLTEGFHGSKIEFFGQDAWGGSYRLETECAIRPVGPRDRRDVYLAVVRRPG